MNIPEEYLCSSGFWRRLVQMSRRLLSQTNFPRGRYDNDIEALTEDIIQETLTRILEIPEPDKPIQNWSGFCYRVMYFLVWEEHREVWRPHEAGREKALGQDGIDVIDLPSSTEEIVDPSLRIDQEMELTEEERSLSDRQQRLKQVVDEHLWRIIREETTKISDDPAFFTFVELRWKNGLTGNAAWPIVVDRATRSRATFFRWFEDKLKPAVMKRWVSLAVAAGGV